jgi:hypothetical protein
MEKSILVLFAHQFYAIDVWFHLDVLENGAVSHPTRYQGRVLVYGPQGEVVREPKTLDNIWMRQTRPS